MQNLMARFGRPKELVAYEVPCDSLPLQREPHSESGGQLYLFMQTEACCGEVSGTEAASTLRLFCPYWGIGYSSNEHILWEASSLFQKGKDGCQGDQVNCAYWAPPPIHWAPASWAASLFCFRPSWDVSPHPTRLTLENTTLW